MYGSMFILDMGVDKSSRDRWRGALSLATTLSTVDGFVAFLVLETEDDSVAGFCICNDASSMEAVRQVAEGWQHEHYGQASSDLQALVTGEVIVQQGF